VVPNLEHIGSEWAAAETKEGFGGVLEEVEIRAEVCVVVGVDDNTVYDTF
jgi:hypothetical protein